MPDPGFGERLRTRFKALGYWKHDRPEVPRFALERRYRPQYVYAWLRDRVPDYDNLLRLARDLHVTPDWLRFGEPGAEEALAAGISRSLVAEQTPGAPWGRVTAGAGESTLPSRPARVIEHPLLRLTDLTERLSRAEAELHGVIRACRASEERLHRVFAEGPLGMGMADPEYRLVKVNQRLCEMLGYSEEELIGRTFLDLTHPDDRPLTREITGRVHRNELPYDKYEKRLVKKNGDVLYVSSTVLVMQDESETRPYSMAVVEDTTERKRTEEELRGLAQQQQLILESVTDGIYGTDEQGLTRFVNSAAVRLMGWEAEHLIGQHIHDSIHKFKPDETRYPRKECPFYTSLGKAAVARGQADVWWRKDGTSVPIEYTRAPIVQDGKMVGSVITFRESGERPSESRGEKTSLAGAEPRRIVVKERASSKKKR